MFFVEHPLPTYCAGPNISGNYLWIICTQYIRGIGIGGATGARAPFNIPVGGLKCTKLVRLDTVATLIIMCSNVRSGLCNLDNFNISLTVN